MSTIYYIKLAANLTNRKISYHAHWNGKEFRASGEPWAVIDNAERAMAEFQRVLTTLKTEYWSGCYQVGLYAEVWQDDKLLKAEFIKTYQTSAFNALQTT